MKRICKQLTMNLNGKISKNLGQVFQQVFSTVATVTDVITKGLEKTWNRIITEKIPKLSVKKDAGGKHKHACWPPEIAVEGKRDWLTGLSRPGIRKFPAIIPMYVLMASGVGIGILAMIRTAVKHPEVSFRKKTNPEPWHEYRNKRYKLVELAGHDYTCPAPEYK